MPQCTIHSHIQEQRRKKTSVVQPITRSFETRSIFYSLTMSGQRANLYTKNAHIWIPSKSNVWQCGQLTQDYKPGDKSLFYEIIGDDIGGGDDNNKSRSRSSSCSSESSVKAVSLKPAVASVRRKFSSEEPGIGKVSRVIEFH